MKKITLGNDEFEGENNVYLIESSNETALVDTGIASEQVRTSLKRQLSDIGVGFGGIDMILLTHWHHDHTGLVGEIQRASDATVYAHETDVPLIRGGNATESFLNRRQQAFETWGMPVAKQQALNAVLSDSAEESVWPSTVESLENGDTVSIGDRDISVYHTPGHSAGHICYGFYGDDGREVFGGDALLPVYTPNVGADVRLNDPLARYLETLRLFTDGEFDRVWPGHRDAIEDPAHRAREIIDHHHDRGKKILNYLQDSGPATAWDVSTHLFGELESIHMMHGPAEAYAHLHHFTRQDVLAEDGTQYQLSSAEFTLDELF